MPAQSNLKTFLPSRPSGPIFIGLNILRLISIISLILVLVANIVTMADDVKAIKAEHSHADLINEDWDCDYVEYSTVPDQTGGSLWSILNRLFIVFECLLLTLSEIGFPRRLFEDFIPVLGPAHGLGALGIFEALIGAQVLSHYCERFPQAVSWLLFVIGCINIIAGILLRSSAKTKRLVFSWENVSTLTPQTRMAATARDMVAEKRNPPNTNSSTTQPNAPLSRSASHHSDAPLLPDNTTAPGARFGGFGFGKQGEKAAAERGWKISKPMESLPRYVV